jgi:type VI secretion system protein ImpM
MGDSRVAAVPVRDLIAMQALEAGFYGKLPSHGDFLRRRVSDAFLGVWDGWLQQCMAASRSALGERWLDVYLTSPVWRFGCAAGTCGPSAVVGVMVPSVDRVGRYFPLTLVAELPNGVTPIVAATLGAPFFDEAEQLVLQTLEAERLNFEEFDERVRGLGQHLRAVTGSPGVVLEPVAAAILSDGATAGWQIPIGSPSHLGPAFEQMLAQRLTALYDPLALWWTEGSSIVEPSCLIVKGLPDPEGFAALLDGSWARGQWRTVPARVERLREEPDPLDELVPSAPRFRSAAATHVGRVRDVNEDAFLERPDVGLWAVADGLGGESEGEVASRMVCDALADFQSDAGFEDTLESARERMQQVNEHLQRAASRPVNPVLSGSTVVAFFARGTRCAVLWAGDSRAYRCRDSRLEQLTADHSADHPDGLIGGDTSHAITRAIGAEATLTLDLHRDRVRAGDRFLLCSDGLTRAVPGGLIHAWMQQTDPRVAVDGLIKAALDAGAPDNVTVVFIEAYA